MMGPGVRLNPELLVIIASGGGAVSSHAITLQVSTPQITALKWMGSLLFLPLEMDTGV